MATNPHTTRAPLLIGLGDHGRPIADEEFCAADFEEPWRYELSEGKVVVMSPDSEEHDDASEPWRDYLGAYRLSHRDCVQKVVSEACVRIEGGKYRIGDIGVYLVGARSGQRRPWRVPELMIEILSPGSESIERDTIQKRAEYHKIGVLEYVIVDYVEGRVMVLTHAPGDYQECVLTAGLVDSTPLLPGLAIPLEEIFPQSNA